MSDEALSNSHLLVTTSAILHNSSDSSDSEINEQLERSLKKVTRLISVPENEKLEEENKFLLTR